MSLMKDIFTPQAAPVSKKITSSRNPPTLNRISLAKIRSKPSNMVHSKCVRNSSSQKPAGVKSQTEKRPLPLAHAPDGAEFHRRRYSFVQCRNQSSQTEPDIENSLMSTQTNVNNNDEEKALEVQLENKLTICDSTVQTDRSSLSNSVVKKRPTKSFRKVIKPVVIIDPDCPAGHQAMSDEERLKMLAELQTSYESNLIELNRLPICVDTLRVRSKRNELENKLKQIEINLKIFGKPKVYIKIDN